MAENTGLHQLSCLLLNRIINVGCVKSLLSFEHLELYYSKMDLSAFVKGSCSDFCPPSEIKMFDSIMYAVSYTKIVNLNSFFRRTDAKLLHFYELHPPLEYNRKTKNLPVKCFSRSAAGNETPKASELRTFNSLFRCVEYLLEYILMDERRPYHYRYDFIFDRLRSIRQEIVIQNLNEMETVKLLEPMVMFLSYSSYE